MRYTYNKSEFNRGVDEGEVFEKYRDDYVREFVLAQSKVAGSFIRNRATHPPILVAMNLAEWNAFYGIGAHMRKLLLDVICPVLIEDDGQTELTEVAR